MFDGIIQLEISHLKCIHWGGIFVTYFKTRSCTVGTHYLLWVRVGSAEPFLSSAIKLD